MGTTELIEGKTVWIAWTLIDAMARDVSATVTEATVFNAEAKLVRTAGGHLRQVLFYEGVFDNEADARAANAAELEAAAERIAAVARQERERAAGVAAKAQVVYV